MRLGNVVLSFLLVATALAARPVPADAAARQVVVEGRVVDSHGDPVGGATVVAVDVRDRKRVQVTTAGAGGRFQGTVPATGTFFLEVCEGRRGGPGCAAMPDALPVFLGPDQQVVTPLLLESYFSPGDRRIEVGRVVLRHRAARLTVITDRSPRTDVSLQSDAPESQGIVPSLPATGLVASEGGVRWRVGSVAPGAYVVHAYSDRANLGPSSYAIHLEPGHNRLDLSGPGPSVSGTVTRDGVPVADEPVRLQRTSRGLSVLWCGNQAVARTDGQGHYLVDEVPKGTYRVSVGGVGQETPYAVADVDVAGRHSQPVADLAIASDEAGRTTGTAPAADGQTAEDRAKQVVSVRDIAGDPKLSRLIGTVPVDPATGAFVIDGLPAGDYGLESSWAPRQAAWTTVTVGEGQTVDATFDPPPVGTGRLTIDLPPGAYYVEMAPSLPAWVPSGSRSARNADDEGRVVIEDQPFGTYDVEASDGEFLTALPQEVAFTHDDQSVTIEQGPRPGEIAGVLTLPDSGRPAPRPGVVRSIFCQRLEGGNHYGQDLGYFYTRRGSTFGSTSLRPGTWTCRPNVPTDGHGLRNGMGNWRLPYYYPPSAPFEVRAGEVTHLDLPLDLRKP
jgi:hypothetical protein